MAAIDHMVDATDLDAALMGHLNEEYPDVDPRQRRAVLDTFRLYWDGDIDYFHLEFWLYRNAGLIGGLTATELYQFLDKREFQ